MAGTMALADADMLDDRSGCWTPAAAATSSTATTPSGKTSFNHAADDTLGPHFAAILADDEEDEDDGDSSFFASRLPKTVSSGGRGGTERADAAAHLSIELQHAFKILRDLTSDANRRVSLPFIDPVDTIIDDIVDYEEVVKRPMWLNKVKELLLGNKYETITEFVADVRQILENCYRYYGPDHAFAKKALKLEQMLEQKLALLPREIRDKTTLETTSGQPNEEPTGIAVRRRCTRQTVDYVSVLLNRVRHEKSFRDKELRKKQTEERKLEKEEKVKETVDWENTVLLGESKEQMRAMWELPLIGHFLYLCQTTLNMPEVSQFELERMLLMPRASSLLPKVMTSLLSNPQMRANLDKKPAMPYRVWNNRLQNRIQSWYKICQAREYRGDLVFQQLGIEAEFFRVLGPENPLNDRMFHELSFHQRVWCLKGLCDYVMQNHKAVQDTMNEQIADDMREYVLGCDAQGNKYLHFPQFCGQDLRIYRQKPVTAPPAPKLWMSVFDNDKKRPLEQLDIIGNTKKMKLEKYEQTLGETAEMSKLTPIGSDQPEGVLATTDAESLSSSVQVLTHEIMPEPQTSDSAVGSNKNTLTTTPIEVTDATTATIISDPSCDRDSTTNGDSKVLANGTISATRCVSEIVGNVTRGLDCAPGAVRDVSAMEVDEQEVTTSEQKVKKIDEDELSTVAAIVRDVSGGLELADDVSVGQVSVAQQSRPSSPETLPPSPVRTRRSARLSMARVQAIVKEEARTTKSGRTIRDGKTNSVPSTSSTTSSSSTDKSGSGLESGSESESASESSDSEDQKVSKSKKVVQDDDISVETENEIEEVLNPVPDIGRFELVVDSLETLRNFMQRFDASTAATVTSSTTAVSATATPLPKSRSRGVKTAARQQPPPRVKCEVQLHERLTNLLTELLPWEIKLDKAAQRVRVRLRKEYEDFVERDEVYDDEWDSDKEDSKKLCVDDAATNGGAGGRASEDPVNSSIAASVRSRNRRKPAAMPSDTPSAVKVEPKVEVDTQELLNQMGDSTEYPTRGRLKQLREGVKLKKPAPAVNPARRKVKPEPVCNGDADYVPHVRSTVKANRQNNKVLAQEHFAWETLRQILVPPTKPTTTTTSAASNTTTTTSTAIGNRPTHGMTAAASRAKPALPAPCRPPFHVASPPRPSTAMMRVGTSSLFSPSPDRRNTAVSVKMDMLGVMQAATQMIRGGGTASTGGSSGSSSDLMASSSARSKVESVWSSSVFSPLRSTSAVSNRTVLTPTQSTLRPTGPAQSPTRPSLSVSTNTRPTYSVQSPLRPSLPALSPLRPTFLAQSPLRPTFTTQSPLRQTGPAQLPVRPNVPMQQPQRVSINKRLTADPKFFTFKQSAQAASRAAFSVTSTNSTTTTVTTTNVTATTATAITTFSSPTYAAVTATVLPTIRAPSIANSRVIGNPGLTPLSPTSASRSSEAANSRMLASIAKQQLQGTQTEGAGKGALQQKTMLMSVRGQDGRTMFVRVASSVSSTGPVQAVTTATTTVSAIASVTTTTAAVPPLLQSCNPTTTTGVRRIPPEATSSVRMVRAPILRSALPAPLRPPSTVVPRILAPPRLMNSYGIRVAASGHSSNPVVEPVRVAPSQACTQEEGTLLIRVPGQNGEPVYMQVPRSEVTTAPDGTVRYTGSLPVTAATGSQVVRPEMSEQSPANPPSPSSYLVQQPLTTITSQQDIDYTPTLSVRPPPNQHRLIPALSPHRTVAQIQSMPSIVPTVTATPPQVSIATNTYHQHVATSPTRTELPDDTFDADAFDADSFFAEHLPNGLGLHHSSSSVATTPQAVVMVTSQSVVPSSHLMVNGIESPSTNTVQTSHAVLHSPVLQNHYVSGLVQQQSSHLQLVSSSVPPVLCQPQQPQPQRLQLVTTVAPSVNHHHQQQVILGSTENSVIHRFVSVPAGPTVTTTATASYVQSSAPVVATTTVPSSASPLNTTTPNNKSANMLLASWMSNPALAAAVTRYTSNGQKVAITLQGDKIVMQALPQSAVVRPAGSVTGVSTRPTIMSAVTTTSNTTMVQPSQQFQRIQIQQPQVVASPQSNFPSAMYHQQPQLRAVLHQQQVPVSHVQHQLMQAQPAVSHVQQVSLVQTQPAVSQIQHQQMSLVQTQPAVSHIQHPQMSLVQTQPVVSHVQQMSLVQTQPVVSHVQQVSLVQTQPTVSHIQHQQMSLVQTQPTSAPVSTGPMADGVSSPPPSRIVVIRDPNSTGPGSEMYGLLLPNGQIVPLQTGPTCTTA